MNTTHDSKPLLSLVALVALGAFAAAGCDSSRAQAITATGAQVNNGGVDFSDPFGGCMWTGGHFPFACSQRGAPCTGGSEGVTCNPPNGCTPETFHIMCDHTCQVDADCPIPATGDSRPVCQPEFHFCQLPCGDTTTCPVGYTCQETGTYLPSDGAGNPLALPKLCMQTITITHADGGAN